MCMYYDLTNTCEFRNLRNKDKHHGVSEPQIISYYTVATKMFIFANLRSKKCVLQVLMDCPDLPVGTFLMNLKRGFRKKLKR